MDVEFVSLLIISLHKLYLPLLNIQLQLKIEMICCFFVLHETKKLPMKTEYPVRDFLASGQLSQSESV